MDAETQKWASQQDFLALLYSLILTSITTVIVYLVDTFFRLNYIQNELEKQGIEVSLLKIYFERYSEYADFYFSLFSPLTDFQFYIILFIVVFGLTAGLLFYREKKEVSTEEVSEFRTKMEQKKLKKAKKIKGRSR
ncbi:MAG: hypothetical protein K8R06_02255 [Methanosarcinales archaeon]|nr:hypothetical protein [Methanosarcinales archaeon]